MTQERQKADPKEEMRKPAPVNPYSQEMIMQDTQHSDWREELKDNVNYDPAELGCEWDVEDIIDFIASEKAKSYEEGIRKAVEVVDKIQNPFHSEDEAFQACEEVMAELNQLLSD